MSINIESLKKKPRMQAKPHYSQANPHKDHGLNVDPKWNDIIMTCPPAKTKFAKQTGGGVEAFGIFYRPSLQGVMMTSISAKSVLAPGPVTMCWITSRARG